MSESYGYVDYDDDPEVGIGIPSEFTQRAMLSEAVGLASAIDRELRGQVPGMLAAYVEHAMQEASAAAAALLTMHPKNERELFELQKRAAGYASVMAWIRSQMIVGREAAKELADMDDRKAQGDE